MPPPPGIPIAARSWLPRRGRASGSRSRGRRLGRGVAAFTVKKVKGGYQVAHVVEHLSRGEANRASLSLLGRYASGEAITLDRELQNGEVLEPKQLKT